jgi:hypothetical protein
MEVLVFRTSVETPQHVDALRPTLDSIAGSGRWNFALDDCDKILRIASMNVVPHVAIRLLNEHGYDCSELED